MNKDFLQYVSNRCELALNQDTEYMDRHLKYIRAVKKEDMKSLQELSVSMESRAVELCYIKGFKDAIELCGIPYPVQTDPV